jgi:hypothetical protein
LKPFYLVMRIVTDPPLVRARFTFVHPTRTNPLSGRIFRAAKFSTWLENALGAGARIRALGFAA